jgi:hypothetical protein
MPRPLEMVGSICDARQMRYVAIISVLLVTAVSAACGSSATRADGTTQGSQRWVTEDSHCKKPEHDYCTIARHRGDETDLILVNIGRGLPYELCVIPLGSPSSRECKSFRTTHRSPYVYASRVVLQKSFSTQAETDYRATWTLTGGQRLGRALRFTTP